MAKSSPFLLLIVKGTFQSELCWIKILDFESLNRKKLIKKLSCIWHKKRHFLLFLFLFLHQETYFWHILAYFHQHGNSLPSTPTLFGGRRGPGGTTRSVDDFLCLPTTWNNCLFLKDAHTGLLSHPACSTMGRVSLESLLPIPHTPKIRTATVQRSWPLQPSEITVHFSNFSINC